MEKIIRFRWNPLKNHFELILISGLIGFSSDRDFDFIYLFWLPVTIKTKSK